MKLTKKYLNEHDICNPYYLAEKVGSKIYINYVPADNGRLTSRYAYWGIFRIDFISELNTKKTGYVHINVHDRTEKEPILQKAIKWVKDTYNIEITDKDPFGAWHPKGTLKKLEMMLWDRKEEK